MSLLVWVLEIIVPWRKNQPLIRKDFWIDGFYMFFNFFLFSLIGYNVVANVFSNLFTDVLHSLGIENLVAINLQNSPVWVNLLVLFLVTDFTQYWIHRLLHKVPWFWEIHKLHHSVTEMGFAAHLRFHWMETVIYKTLTYIPLAMIGFGLDDFFFVHTFSVLIGHLNHANIPLTYGPFKYILNNPAMHIWHHAKEMPSSHPVGINFGISLSIWDYIFKTDYIPYDGKDIPLGFEDVEKFPQDFADQFVEPFKKE